MTKARSKSAKRPPRKLDRMKGFCGNGGFKAGAAHMRAAGSKGGIRRQGSKQ